MKEHESYKPQFTIIIVLLLIITVLVGASYMQITQFAKSSQTSTTTTTQATPAVAATPTATKTATPAATPTATPASVVKSDKPIVEVFVMSHCPYGTQIEKGLIPVIKTLGTKAQIDIKFVNYAMHGEKEVKEQLNQYCIQKAYPQKFVDYLTCFLEAGDGAGCMAKSSITDANLQSCKDEAEKTYKVTELFNDPAKAQWKGSFPPFLTHDAENKKYGVSGSPSLVINGAKVTSARDASSLLATICSAFKTKPAECNTDLSANGNPAAGFGFKTQAAATPAAGGCG